MGPLPDVATIPSRPIESAHLLLGHFPVVLWTTDASLKVTYCMGDGLAGTSFVADSVVGRTVDEIIADNANRDELLSSYRTALAGRGARFESALLGRVFEAHLEPLRDDAGAIVGCIGMALDITERKAVEESLRESEEFSRTLTENIPAGILLLDEGRIIYANRAVRDISGFTADEALTLDRLPLEDEYLELVNRRQAAMLAGEEPADIELRIRTKDGRERWVSSVGRRVQHRGKPAVLAVITDIDERKQVEVRLEREVHFRGVLNELLEQSLVKGLDEAFFQRILDAAVSAIPGAQAGSLLRDDGSGTFHFQAVNGFDAEGLRPITFSAKELRLERQGSVPTLLFEMVPRPESQDERYEILRVAGRVDELKVSLSFPIVLGEQIVAYFNLDNFEDEAAFSPAAIEMAKVFASQVSALLWRFDLEQKLLAEREVLTRTALHDQLTGLPNRTQLISRLNRMIEPGSQTAGAALMFIDIDNFKYINDTLGHPFGDRVVRAVAAILSDNLTDGIVARWGGDEFVVVTEATDPCQAAGVAERLRKLLSRQHRIDELDLLLTASFGVTFWPQHASSADELISRADIALYQAKAAGKNTVRLFTPAMNESVAARVELERDLRLALVGADELVLHYQPRVDLVTGEIGCVEALVRWNHPTRGMLLPSDFVPFAEEVGLIDVLGRRVLLAACQQSRAWREQGLRMRIAVNLSALQLQDPEFVTQLRECMASSGVTGEYLELEITESAAMKDVASCSVLLARLRELGIRITLDDFGTAYSSLAQLRRLPIDIIKIDRSFVSEMAEDSAATGIEATGIVRTILALADGLNLSTVAEGVTTLEQRRLLLQMGCGTAQGFLYSKPRPPHEVTEMLRRRVLKPGN